MNGGLIRFFLNKEFNYVRLPFPDDSLSYFEGLKTVSELYWEETTPNNSIYGYQIMQHSKWRPGLHDEEILNFEKALGLPFPNALRNFYKTMNGLTKPGINIYGNDGTPFAYYPLFYSYPEDLELIKERIEWIYSANTITKEQLEVSGISRIFPIYSHRFLLLDVPGNPVLSMYGNDILFWADNLSKLLAIEIFNKIEDGRYFESNQKALPLIKFWLDS